jgi:hypothetical protein
MAQRHIEVNVYDSGGKPAPNANVTLWIYQFGASGHKDARTGSNGKAVFDVDMDNGAEISISVNSKPIVERGKPKPPYSVYI